MDTSDRGRAGSMQVHSQRHYLQVGMVVLASNRRKVLTWAHKQLQNPGYWCNFLWLHTLPGMHTVMEAGDGLQGRVMHVDSWRN